jgi:acyl-CoA hydrolase
MTSVSDTYIENRERVGPNDTNNYGTAHGGNVVKWMDEVGVMAAMRHAGENCVTARINQLNFTLPIPQGENCVIEAYAYETGRTSIRVRLRAARENPHTGEREQTTDSYFIFVAIDDESTPTPVPDLAVETERCRKLRQEALDGEQNLE